MLVRFHIMPLNMTLLFCYLHFKSLTRVNNGEPNKITFQTSPFHHRSNFTQLHMKLENFDEILKKNRKN